MLKQIVTSRSYIFKKKFATGVLPRRADSCSERTSRQLLAVLRDETVTRGMKNTPPSAAVENIGQ